MPVLFTFLFKVNIALALFCLGYYAVLRPLTFYTLNRVYLAGAILFASIYPWIDINSFVQRHQQFTAPVQHIIIQWKEPAVNLVKPLDQPNYWQWAETAFWIGAIILAVRLLLQLFSLYRLYRNSEPSKVHNYPVRLISGDVGPFSFWRSIYVNPDNLSAQDLEKVLEHEHIHVSEWHTLDILLAELSTIFYWFNPGIWLMKKAVRENIEFITDQKILQKGVDSKQYQYSLLTVSMAGAPNTLVNNFNISTIKKRIIMMNAKRSSRFNLGRYMFVAPAIIILLLAFSISKADIAKKHISNTIKSITSAIKSVAISNNDLAGIHPASKQAGKVIAATIKTKVKTTVKLADTIYSGKTKDGKKAMLITDSNGLDSVGYVINGAKATREDVKALDPAHILGMEIMPAKNAKEFVDFALDKPEILFVTTDDSEKGRNLKARIDKSMRAAMQATVNISKGTTGSNQAATGSGRSYTYFSTVNVGTDSKDTARAGTVYAVTSDMTPVVVSDNANLSGAGVVVTTDVKPLKRFHITGSNVTKVRVNGVDMAPMVKLNDVEIDTVAVKRYPKSKNFIYLNKARSSDETTIDSPGNKLIIVDGKEVKNLKNISPDNIKSLTILKNEAAEKLYGDKGKNGVLVITTKKGGK